MTVDEDDASGPDRALAVTAWIFILTSFWLPWWLVRYSDDAGNRYEQLGAWLWRPVDELTTGWAPIVTGVLAALLAIHLFIRVAGRSWHHEPTIWRRDLWIQAEFAGVVLASTLAWPDPDNFPSFWGGRTFTDPASGASFTETALPGLGWWCMAVAFLLLVIAAVKVRLAADASDK